MPLATGTSDGKNKVEVSKMTEKSIVDAKGNEILNMKQNRSATTHESK